MDQAVVTKKSKVSAYLSDEVKVDADKLAELEKRSLSNLIEVLLQEAIDKAKKEGRL